jgi:hypothetical protein
VNVSEVTALLALGSIALFVIGLKRLSKVRTARSGNALMAAGMLLAVVLTLVEQGLVDYRWIAGGLALLAVVGNIIDNKRYARVAAAHGGMAPPEARLPAAMVGSILIPVGMFWFAWTNGPDVHWSVPIIGSGVFGAGIVLIFLSLMTYLVDSYVIFAASVLAANSVLRSLFGAAFPLFTTYMYHDLGVHWASSIPAFLAIACIPCPFIFYKYGAQIRMKCEFASEAANVLQRMRTRHEVVDEDEAMAEVVRKRTNASRASKA